MKVRSNELIYLMLFLSTLLFFSDATTFQNYTLQFIIPVLLIVFSILLAIYKYGIERRLLILYFALIAIFSTSFLIDLVYRFDRIGEGYMGYYFINFLLYGILLINSRKIKVNLRLINRAVEILVVLILITSLLNIFDFLIIEKPPEIVTSHVGYAWYFLNPNGFGLLMFFFLSYIVFFNTSRYKNILLIIAFLLMFLSLSRTAIFSGVILLIGYVIKEKKLKFFNILQLLVILTLLYVFLEDLLESYIEGYLLKSETGSSGRVSIWLEVIFKDIFNNSPDFLLGKGFTYEGVEGLGLTPHNSFLFLIGRQGTVFTMAVLVYVFVFIKRMMRKNVLTISYIFSLVFIGMFESVFFVGGTGIWLGTLFTLSLLGTNKSSK